MTEQLFGIQQTIDNKTISINMTLFSPTNSCNETIIYLHGGGLLYGTRNDLPKTYLEQFLNAGYHFLTIDYPLAPNFTATDINQSVFQSIEWFLEHFNSTLHLKKSSYILFGRSSGSYLMFKVISSLIENKMTLPRKLINFYGYTSFDLPEFKSPNPKFHNNVNLKFEHIQKYLTHELLADDPSLSRFILYVYARQYGKWLDYLGISESNLNNLEVEDKLLLSFPRTFHAASSMDQDVPFRISKRLSKVIPNSSFYPVYNLPHDFDTATNDPQAIKAYQALLTWLKE